VGLQHAQNFIREFSKWARKFLASFLVGQNARCCFWFGAFLGIICPAKDDLQKHLKHHLEVAPCFLHLPLILLILTGSGCILKMTAQYNAKKVQVQQYQRIT
jgi:hypothetical protein